MTLSLEGDAEVMDLFDATWLLTSESFSEEAFTSRSKLGFIVDLRSDLEKLLHILDEKNQVEPLCILRNLEDLILHCEAAQSYSAHHI